MGVLSEAKIRVGCGTEGNGAIKTQITESQEVKGKDKSTHTG